MKTKLPVVYEYNNFRKFLADYQTARQSFDPGFSKSALSRILGLPNTRSFFTDVLRGKKVSGAFIERFAKVLELTKDESQFFRVLVMFNQAENPEERELYFDQLISLNKTPKRVLDKSVFIYYKYWHNSAIRALLHFYDFKDDYSQLARKLNPSITAKQAKDSIALLKKLDLIRQNALGFFKPTDKSIVTPDFAKDEFLKQYQLSCLDMAKHALVKNTATPQLISTNMISISSQAYARIEKKIGKFRSEIRSLVHKDEHPAEQVYQMNIVLFPASNKRTPS
jgi:uncharacterized protein (TIGR02147 family)